MANLSRTLEKIAAGRATDPLAPVTVIVPSHVSAIQMRRRLAALVPFAGVRFETLPRLAELIAGADLAAAGRSPLARPIGDYLAAQVALRSRRELAAVRELPGYGRVLRQLFRRLRRAGISSPESVKPGLSNSYMGELLRLYGEFRNDTRRFYDEEDLLEAAAGVVSRGSTAARELGALYLVPPGALSAGADALVRAMRRNATSFDAVSEGSSDRNAESFVLAPDPASEVREAVREVLAKLANETPLHEVAIFHGADAAYRCLLRDALDAAGLPAAIMPGIPLSETIAGRSVLALASLPAEDYSRTAVMDFLALAPLKARIPAGADRVAPLPATWDRLSREAGITKTAGRWRDGLGARQADLEAELGAQDLDLEEWRRDALRRQLNLTRDLSDVIASLVARLEPLRPDQPATDFIDRFKAVVLDYISEDEPALERVIGEIDQLGTVGAVGGSFALAGFVQALRANLEIAHIRERSLGEGILVADYRLAAGLQFEHVILCGAFEGSFPAGPGGDTLVDDSDWTALRESFPWIEDATLRIERATAAARRAVASSRGTVTWTAPLYEPGGTREYYPSPLMVEAARAHQADLATASALRRAANDGVVRRSPSPLAAGLRGPALDRGETGIRLAVRAFEAGSLPGPGQRLHLPLLLLRSRRDPQLTEFDGNLAALSQAGRLTLSRYTSPTALETYAGCGFRYLCGQVLRISPVEEPEEREVMDAAERGTLVHDVLETFFRERRAEDRPAPGERWNDSDQQRLREIAEQKLEQARRRGTTGLDIFAAHDAATILADLVAFLEEDNVFRSETRAVPADFEVRMPPTEVGGIEVRGFADRIDFTADGRKAWVIDYKTGSVSPYKGVGSQADPFKGGTKLQLPAYVAAARQAERVEALYWFISRKGGFERVPYSPTPQNQARFEAIVRAILGGAAAGSFPAVPGGEDDFYATWENCRFCDFDRICSRRRDQDFELKVASEPVRPWLAVGEAARELRP